MHALRPLTICAALALAAFVPAHAAESAAGYVDTLYGDGGAYEPAPIVRVAPAYPAEAADKGLEGDVVLEFTIAESGGVKDLEVIESSDPVFEPPALEAVAQWKYRPQLRDGKPHEFKGLRVMLAFRLAKDED